MWFGGFNQNWHPGVLFSLRATLDKKQRDPEFFLQGIRQIGRLFDFDASEPYDYIEFGHILEEVDKKFNIDTRIREVSAFFQYLTTMIGI